MSDEMLPLRRGRGVAHCFNCIPLVYRICVLLTHLFVCTTLRCLLSLLHFIRENAFSCCEVFRIDGASE